MYIDNFIYHKCDDVYNIKILIESSDYIVNNAYLAC
jgi:hypothetical protein